MTEEEEEEEESNFWRTRGINTQYPLFCVQVVQGACMKRERNTYLQLCLLEVWDVQKFVKTAPILTNGRVQRWYDNLTTLAASFNYEVCTQPCKQGR
jgi:hypothetical protein